MAAWNRRSSTSVPADGVNIACSAIGDGPAFVVPPPAMPWSHLQLEWEIPEWRDWSERLAGRAQLVRYDARGSGLSDRDVTDLSLDANVRDLEAVVDGLGLARVALFGCYFASPVAIAYAARHPERVSHLVLWCGLPSSEESQNDAQRSGALRQLLDVDYESVYGDAIATRCSGGRKARLRTGWRCTCSRR